MKRGDCAACPKLHYERAAKNEVFLRCRAGGDDPRFADRVIDIAPAGYAAKHAETLEPPMHCPRRKAGE